MSKIRDNYLAELLIIGIITLMLLSSCASNYSCPAYGVTESEVGPMYADQEWDKE
tara:strand:- start:129 stop:293 length:165 start_codon:yes stop_codon:yes gene_type:complete